MTKEEEIKDCEKLANGVCLMGYQSCALTMWHPNCKSRKTQQPDKVSKQEEIREGIKRISCRWCEQNSYCEKSCGVPERDLQKLADLGVVIKVDGELPFARVDIDGKPEVGRFYDGYKASMDDHKEAGYVAVEPLID